jgi:hypothetical protein
MLLLALAVFLFDLAIAFLLLIDLYRVRYELLSLAQTSCSPPNKIAPRFTGRNSTQTPGPLISAEPEK